LKKKSSLAYLENITSFVNACEHVGVPKDCLFEPQEFLSKNSMKVVQTLHYLSALVKERGMKAPFIPERFLVLFNLN